MKRKRWLCRLGFHDTYGNTSATNIGTPDAPIFMTMYSRRCNRCDWIEWGAR